MPYETTKYSELNRDMINKWKDKFKEKIIKTLEEFKPDVIICHHLWMLTSLVIDIVDQVAGHETKIIGVCHGTDIRQCKNNPKLKSKYVKNIHKLDMIFALSELQVPEITREYNIEEEKIVVMGGGFNQNIFYRDDNIKKNKNQIDVVFAGKIAKSKGIYQLIESFPIIRKKYKNVYLHIIGSPDEYAKNKLNEMISGKDNIKKYNVKNQVALGELFRETDIFVMPSYFEGLGLVAIESLACGMRVVSTEVEGLMSLLDKDIKNSGIIEFVKLPRLKNTDEPYEEDLEEFRTNLAIGISKQIDRHLNKDEISSEIVKKINKYSWENIVKIMDEIIKKL